MSAILIIGAGGVGRVTACKCAQQDIFDHVFLASRTLRKCEEIAKHAGQRITARQLDADNPSNVEQLIRETRAGIVINVALPYQDIPIMQGCLAAGAHYIDTAVPEIPGELWCTTDDAQWYGLQWEMHEAFKDAGLLALLGMGSDPGLVNVFCEIARREHFDSIHSIDIMDVNAGNHGYPFATNFNPEINLREVQAPAHFWADGQWHNLPALSHGASFDFPDLGPQPIFLMDHDEIHSLRKFFPEAAHIKFWMGFGEQYRTHFDVLRNVGMLSPEPVKTALDDGSVIDIVPLKLLKQLLPDPASLAARYTGKTCIGSLITGTWNGNPRQVFIYNICDHEVCFREIGSQAISFTAGVPPAVAAVLIARGDWTGAGVRNAEQMDPRPFLNLIPELGMAWELKELDPSVPFQG